MAQPKIQPGSQAESVKETLLPGLIQSIRQSLRNIFVRPPACMLIFFEHTGDKSRTHYMTDADNKEEVLKALKKLTVIIEHDLADPPGGKNPKNN